MYNQSVSTSSVSPSVFKFKDSHNVRIQLTIGEPWFCLPDVAEVLGISRTSDLLQAAKGVVIYDTLKSRGSLDAKGMAKYSIPTLGGQQELTFINEPNLYRIIFRSNKTEAKEFQDWVFNEVLPSIRKTGSYRTENIPESIDVHSLLLDNLGAPSLALPEDIKKAIDQKAFVLAHEALELCREHLAKKVAYTCEQGNPRYINKDKAFSIISEGDLGSALAHKFYSHLTHIENVSRMTVMLANDYRDAIAAAVNGKSIKKLAN